MNTLPRLTSLVTVIALSAACAGGTPQSSTPASSPPPTHLVLRVDTVRVSPQRPNGTSWDDVEPPRDDAFCQIVGGAVGTAVLIKFAPAAPVAADMSTALCKALDAPMQRQHDPTLPDLQVRLAGGTGGAYVTDTRPDTTLVAFAEAFVVPVDAIPPDGLRVEVVDNDDPRASGAGQAETISALRLSRDELLAALASPTHLLRRQQPPALLDLEIVVTPYVPATNRAAMSANEGTSDARVVAMAGEVLRVRTEGTYRIGSWHSDDLSPSGYPGGGPRQYNWNVEPLASAAHGAAFLLVGRHTRSAHLTPGCTTLLVAHPGPIVLGVNDRDPSNNTGSLSFTIERRAPSAAEWLQQTQPNDCW